MIDAALNHPLIAVTVGAVVLFVILLLDGNRRIRHALAAALREENADD